MSVEVESHHVDAKDTFGKMTALQTAILAVLLSVFTIYSHRAHTETIMLGNETTNQWSHYQAKRIRDYQLEMNTGLVKLLAPNSTESAKILEDYAKQKEKYSKDLEEIKKEGDDLVVKEKLVHRKAGYFDLAEGLLEIAMILSSLYFLTHKRLFPIMGLLLGASGVVVGVLGYLLH